MSEGYSKALSVGLLCLTPSLEAYVVFSEAAPYTATRVESWSLCRPDMTFLKSRNTDTGDFVWKKCEGCRRQEQLLLLGRVSLSEFPWVNGINIGSQIKAILK